jgi:uncharacterized membrane protein YgcG
MITTAVLPLVYLALGIRLRRRLLIGCGVAALLASLVTVRFYVHVAPLWVVLTFGGLLAMAIALALERWLESGSGRERGGFTAQALDDERNQRLAELAVLATHPSVQPERAAPGEWKGGGGSFGGGGATGEY